MTGQPAFALLHGGGQGSWVWEHTTRALLGFSARVLVLDVPGCGTKRGRDVSALDADEIAAELIADIRMAGLSDVVLVGHFLAGAILPRMAALEQGLFRRLVYLSCSAARSDQSFAGMIGAGLHGENEDEVGWPVDPTTHSHAQRYRIMFCNDMAPTEADAFLARLGQDMWPMDVMTRTGWRYDHLTEIAASYVVCERDESLPPTWQERFAKRLNVVRVVHIDAGHQAMNTQPVRLAEILMAEARLS